MRCLPTPQFIGNQKSIVPLCFAAGVPEAGEKLGRDFSDSQYDAREAFSSQWHSVCCLSLFIRPPWINRAEVLELGQPE
jgi:hypothetical protein